MLKRKRICVLVSNATLHNNTLMIEGIIKKAYAFDYDVCVFATFIRKTEYTAYREGEINIFNLPNFEDFDGVILLGDSIQIPGLVEQLEERLMIECACPVVVLDKESKRFPYIAINDEVTFEHLVDHMIEHHGFTKINCLTGFKGHMHAENRLQGYFNSLRKHNIPIEEERYAYGDFWVDIAAEYAHKIIEKKVPWPEAVVCGADYSAMAMIRELVKAGIRVPEDIAVVGYDTCEQGIAYIPCVTSAVQPYDIHGSNAVNMIRNIIEGTNEPVDMEHGGELVIAQSCGCNKDLYYQQRLINQDKNNDYLMDFFEKSTFMNETLTSATSIKECLKEVANHTHKLCNCQEFYVCLCDDWNQVKEVSIEDWEEESKEKNYRIHGYTDDMWLYVSKVNGQSSYERIKFSVKDMLPALNQEREYPTTYFFTPVHFIDRCLGYLVINFGKEASMFGPYYRTWTRNINNAIETVRSHNEMLYYNKKVNNFAIHDELTGVNNRLGFNIKAKEMIKECKNSGKQFMMITGDMDNLKGINDVFGHLEGDNAIRMVAKAFSSVKGENGYVARLGGDEFVIMMTGLFDDEYTKSIIDSIHKYLDQYNLTSGKPYKVCVSLGCYYNFISENNSQNNDVLDEYLYVSDQFMYQVKQEKKETKKGSYYRQ